MTDTPRRAVRRRLFGTELVPAVLVLLMVVCAGLAASLYFKEYRPSQQTDPRVAATVVRSASDGTAALLSYAPESLDKDFATARSHLSGEFLSYYNDLTQRIIAPAAKQKSLKTTAHVVAAALSELRPDSAVVLVYVDQTTTSNDSPDPTTSTSSALVRMARINGNWLIVKFDPFLTLHGESAPQRLSVQCPVLFGDNPIRHHRVEAVECGSDDVQFGVDVGMQQPVCVVDGFVAARIDLGAADERGRQPLQVGAVRGNMVTAGRGVAQVMAPCPTNGLAVESWCPLKFSSGRRRIGIEHRLVQDLHQNPWTFVVEHSLSQACDQRGAGVATHHHHAAGIDGQLRLVLDDVSKRGLDVVQCRGTRVFGRQPVVHRNHHAVGIAGQVHAMRVIGVQVPGHEAAAVGVQQQRRRRVGGAAIQPEAQPAGVRTGDVFAIRRRPRWCPPPRPARRQHDWRVPVRRAVSR